jgi:hypothetical protein
VVTERRAEVFQLRCSTEERERWAEAAHREYVSLSEWLRRAAHDRLDGLSAGEQPADGKVGSRSEAVAPPVARKTSGEKGATSQSAPAESPCRRAHLHHTNHGGRPCPECGFPT